MRGKWLMISFLAVGLLTACNSNDERSQESTESEDVKTLVQDYSSGKIEGVTASITSEQLLVTDSDGKEESMDLPDDEFFVSIAPYENTTHP